MELVSLDCNQCGAPLSVPEGTKFMTCRHCGAKLAVRHNADVSYTEQLASIDERTARIEEKLSGIELHDEIEALDRQWEIDRAQYLVTGKHGRDRVPSAAGSAFGGVIAVGFGVIWTVVALGMTSQSPIGFAKVFPLFGLLFIAMGFFVATSSYRKSQRYQEAYRRYREKRRALEMRDSS